MILAVRILLAVILFAILLGVMIAIPEARSAWRLWREKRAIVQREKAAQKRHADAIRWGLMCYPREQRRIANSTIDPARRTGQFAIPDRMRDAKGVTR